MTSMTLEKIRKEVATMNYDEKVALLQLLASELAKQPAPQHTLMELDGLGKESWAKTPADEYVNKLREEWK